MQPHYTMSAQLTALRHPEWFADGPHHDCDTAAEMGALVVIVTLFLCVLGVL